jgi:hypothetical protein
MVSANKFDCHSPAPVQNPVQVDGSTSKEYGEDIGGAVSRNWECDRQEKRQEQATCSHTRHCWDHSCECGLISNTEVCATDSRRKWGIAFDSMARTLNQSTHASVQDPCLPVSDNCVTRKVDKVCRGIRWSLAAEHSHSWNTFGLVMRPTFTSRRTLTRCAFLGHSASTSNSWIHSACPENLGVVCGFHTGPDWAFHVWGLCHWGELHNNARLLLPPSTETETMFFSCTVVPTGWS